MDKLKDKILSANIEEHKKEAKYYDTIHTELFNYYEQKRINKALDVIINNFDKNCKILDVGCGTGNLTIKILERGFKNITSVDISKEMMNELMRKVKNYNHNIKFIVSDVDSFLENNISKFDIILMGSVLHHLPDYVNTLKKIKRVLNKKGCIYATHEPLVLPRKSILIRLLLKMDFFVYAARYIFLVFIGKLKYLNRSCEYSDYHTGDRAINLIELEKIFGDNYKLEIEKYSVAKFGFTAFLLDKMKYFNNFELVAIKK